MEGHRFGEPASLSVDQAQKVHCAERVRMDRATNLTLPFDQRLQESHARVKLTSKVKGVGQNLPVPQRLDVVGPEPRCSNPEYMSEQIDCFREAAYARQSFRELGHDGKRIGVPRPVVFVAQGERSLQLLGRKYAL